MAQVTNNHINLAQWHMALNLVLQRLRQADLSETEWPQSVNAVSSRLAEAIEENLSQKLPPPPPPSSRLGGQVICNIFMVHTTQSLCH